MDFRSVLDQVKQAFVIGKNNPFLHGRQGRQPDEPRYEDTGWQQPQTGPYQPAQGQPQGQQPQSWQPTPDAWQQAPQYQQQAPQYQQPQAAYQPPQQQYASPQPQPWQPGQDAWQQAPQYQQQAPHQPAYEAPQPEPQQQFQSQFNPEPMRNRRAQQHQQPQPMPQAPKAVPENLVPFPGAQLPEQKQMDAYVINVYNINSCRQAMSCLRKGQCTLIVMDQLIDKAEIRRYVDMLTGACYALGGTMTRLSAKIGFYIMAPSGMTVFTDPTTTSANQQPRPQAQPAFRADTTPGAAPARAGYEFSPQGAYAAVPQMQFAAHQPQQAEQPQQEAYQPEQQPGFDTWQEQHHQPYAANS